jgi:hypothetical protein
MIACRGLAGGCGSWLLHLWVDKFRILHIGIHNPAKELTLLSGYSIARHYAEL